MPDFGSLQSLMFAELHLSCAKSLFQNRTESTASRPESFNKHQCAREKGQQAWDGDAQTMRVTACTQIQEGRLGVFSFSALQILVL